MLDLCRTFKQTLFERTKTKYTSADLQAPGTSPDCCDCFPSQKDPFIEDHVYLGPVNHLHLDKAASETGTEVANVHTDSTTNVLLRNVVCFSPEELRSLQHSSMDVKRIYYIGWI